jgi:hypothetical protein
MKVPSTNPHRPGVVDAGQQLVDVLEHQTSVLYTEVSQTKATFGTKLTCRILDYQFLDF